MLLGVVMFCADNQDLAGSTEDFRVIELALMCTQTGFDIAKALQIGQLRECHAEVLVETTKPFYIPFALVALHTAPECMHRQVVGHLGKNELACIYAWLRKYQSLEHGQNGFSCSSR